MKVLHYESCRDTFSVGIVDGKGNISADARDMFQTKEGGLIPDIVAKHHREVSDKILKEALEQANLSLEDTDVISFSQGPGLAPSLLVGMEFAKKLAKSYNKPLVGVNHIVAHLEIGRLLTKAKDPVFVFVSGANTQIIAHEGGRYRVFGECLSIALGNALDKFGRIIGLGFPAGPKIEELAKKGSYLELPYNVKGMDVDFSGIITKAESLYKKGAEKEDLCYSLQETCFAMLTEVAERAVAHCGKNEVLLIGGVAANKRFCGMLDIMCKERDAKFYAAPLKYAGDQGVMIAWQGILQHKAGLTQKADSIDINPRWRADQVETSWR